MNGICFVLCYLRGKLLVFENFLHGRICTYETINLLKPIVNYSGRTAQLTSKVAFYIFIQQI